jgi:nucleoside 2-deoxyribosyltransferase
MEKKKTSRVAYLAGPMEYAENAGLDWRLDCAKALKQLDISCVIPELEEQLITDQEELNQLKINDIRKYIGIMRQLIKLDINFVHTLDLIIVKWEGERMSGTIGEVQEAYLRGRPVYLVTSQPLSSVPGWFLACCQHASRTIDQLALHLSGVETGIHLQ